MKESTQRKRSHMSLVNAVNLPADEYFYSPSLQPKPIQRRLHVVAPQGKITPTHSTHLGRNVGLYSASLQHRLPTLTTEEVVQVHLATVRESSRHRYWPSDVVQRFLTADVVKQ